MYQAGIIQKTSLLTPTPTLSYTTVYTYTLVISFDNLIIHNKQSTEHDT